MTSIRFRYMIGGWHWFNPEVRMWLPVPKDDYREIGTMIKHTLGLKG